MPFADLAAAELKRFGPSLLDQAGGDWLRFRIGAGPCFEPQEATIEVQVS